MPLPLPTTADALRATRAAEIAAARDLPAATLALFEADNALEAADEPATPAQLIAADAALRRAQAIYDALADQTHHARDLLGALASPHAPSHPALNEEAPPAP